MQKDVLWKKREEFFQQILEMINKPPMKIDDILDQSRYYVKPSPDKTFFLTSTGDFAINVVGTFYDTRFEVWYSMWQFGTKLVIGIYLGQDVQGAFTEDVYNEAEALWGSGIQPRIDVSHGGVFYNWEFDVPELFESYLHQERFIVGTRHMHFRTMRMIHDYLEKQHFKAMAEAKGISL